MAKVRATIDKVAATETADVLRSEGIDVIEGRARLAGEDHVDVGSRLVGYRRLVLATGAGPALPDIPGLSGTVVLTNQNIFDLAAQPRSLLVIGGGPIGVELAQAFARLGTDVTIVEARSRLLPREEPEASTHVAAALGVDGVQIHSGRTISAFATTSDGTQAELDDGTVVAVASVLLAVGRQADTSELGLAERGVVTDQHGYITTDNRMQTNIAGIYAAGDVTGRAAYTHAADEMGRIAAINALSRVPYRRFRHDCIPAVTFTDPEVARVGLTEAAAAITVPRARVAYVPLDEIDRAVTSGRTDGYIKLIAGPRRTTGALGGGRVLGATVVASHAGEMISVPTLAMRNGMYPARLALTVQAYPTWSLGIRQAAAQFFVETEGRRSRPAQRATEV
jgi:pyruvate/2-oxoglutarate dehydrogenase complex dihydrolipoamide dehydrogenase (E3) component